MPMPDGQFSGLSSQVDDVLATMLDPQTASQPTLTRIIQHIAANSANLDPLREQIASEAQGVQLGSQELIDLMAKAGNAASRVMDAEQQANLELEATIKERLQKIGFDAQAGGDDRFQDLSARLQAKQDELYAVEDKIANLETTNFADNPIQWVINQVKIASEKDNLQRLGAVTGQLKSDLSTIHSLSQETIKTTTAASLAKTEGELLALKESAAIKAGIDLAQAKSSAGLRNIQAVSAVLGAKADEQSLMFKVHQLTHDQQMRQRDAEKDALQLEMLRLQLGKLKDETADKKALVADMRSFVVDELGGDARVVEAAPNESILNNKPLQEAYFASRGITGPQGPYSALNSVEQAAGINSPVAQLPAANWVRKKTNELDALMDPKLAQKIGPGAEEAQRKYYDEGMLQALKQELAGDADDSMLMRISPIGVLRQNEAIKNTYLFKKYLASAEDSTWYSLKQIIGFALKDPELKENGAARARLVKDITTITQADYNFKLAAYGFEKFGLHDAFRTSVNGYKIAPKELLDSLNAGRPATGQLKFLDMSKAGDVQLLVNMVVDTANTPWYRRSPLTPDFGNELRAKDNTYRGSVGEPPVAKPKGSNKPNMGPHGVQ